MSKEKIEKIIDVKFGGMLRYNSLSTVKGRFFTKSDIKDCLFKEILPEVLRDVLDIELCADEEARKKIDELKMAGEHFGFGQVWSIEEIKKKVKELYNIEL